MDMHHRCTRNRHPHTIPRWLLPATHEKSPYQERIKVFKRRHGEQAFQVMLEEQQIHLRGFRDSYNFFFCGFCGIWPVRFIDLGASLGFPDLHTYYAEFVTRECVGYDKWRTIVVCESVVLIESCVRALERSLTKK